MVVRLSVFLFVLVQLQYGCPVVRFSFGFSANAVRLSGCPVVFLVLTDDDLHDTNSACSGFCFLVIDDDRLGTFAVCFRQFYNVLLCFWFSCCSGRFFFLP